MSNGQIIVLVEDDEFLRRLYQTKLTQEGFEVKVAEDGEKAVSLVQETIPAVVLLDVGLPKKDGFMVLAELKANSSTRSIPVVMLTNSHTQADVTRAQELGAAGYLIKAHFLPSEVVAKVKSLIK